MAEKLIFDDGIVAFEVNGKETLRFNPSDPNVYKRFKDVADQVVDMESDYTEKVKAAADGLAVIDLMAEYDRVVKERLSYVFGADNDFDRILGGVNLMAIGQNGERIVTNVFAALKPILEAGVQEHRKSAASEAVAQAEENRAQRGAGK